MTTNNIPSHGGKLFFYYRCAKRLGEGKGVCSQRKNYRADKMEPQVWELVSGIMKDPEQLRDDLERMIDQERKGLHGYPYREAKVWAEKLVEVDRLRGGYQDLAAKGLMTFEELEEKLRELEETRKIAERELEALRTRRERIEELERDKEGLLESYAGMAPEALGSLLPEERHQVYKMLRLKVIAHVDHTLEVNGVFTGDLCVSNAETGSLRPWPPQLVAVEQVVRRDVVLVHGLLDEPQPQNLCIERHVLRCPRGYRREVMQTAKIHPVSSFSMESYPKTPQRV
jgi:hypothetical protein